MKKEDGLKVDYTNITPLCCTVHTVGKCHRCDRFFCKEHGKVATLKKKKIGFCKECIEKLNKTGGMKARWLC